MRRSGGSSSRLPLGDGKMSENENGLLFPVDKDGNLLSILKLERVDGGENLIEGWRRRVDKAGER